MARCFTTRDDYTAAETEFMLAMHAYKLAHRRPYPDCRDVLAVAYSLGYRRVAPARPLPVVPGR